MSDLPPPADHDAHRTQFVEQMRRVPGAVAIVAAAGGGSRTGMAATAWNSLCADPPLLLVCVNRNASVHGIIVKHRAFAINLLPAFETETVAIFSGQRDLRENDRFAQGEWDEGPLGQPFFRKAAASFECELLESHVYGTHEIFIGKVEAMRSRGEEEPMVYFDGRFCTPASAP